MKTRVIHVNDIGLSDEEIELKPVDHDQKFSRFLPSNWFNNFK